MDRHLQVRVCPFSTLCTKLLRLDCTPLSAQLDDFSRYGTIVFLLPCILCNVGPRRPQSRTPPVPHLDNPSLLLSFPTQHNLSPLSCPVCAALSNHPRAMTHPCFSASPPLHISPLLHNIRPHSPLPPPMPAAWTRATPAWRAARATAPLCVVWTGHWTRPSS